MNADAITTEIAPEGKPSEAIAEASGQYEAIVMGESDPSLATFVFGMPAEQIAERFHGPVFVVKREQSVPESDGDENGVNNH